MKIDRLKTDLAKAKEKAAEWQARVRDLEKQITEQENLEILQVVRGVAASPEELRGLLDIPGGSMCRCWRRTAKSAPFRRCARKTTLPPPK